MKPTTEQILSALNKLVKESKKTELKVEKVELGITDDIDKLFNQTKESTKDFLATRKKLSDIAADKNKAVSKLNKKAETLRKKFESAAKELGIDVKKSEPYSDLEFITKRLGEVQNGFARMSAKIFQEKI